MGTENKISQEKNILLVLLNQEETSKELKEVTEQFCGQVIYKISEIPQDLKDKQVYVCGNLESFRWEGHQILVLKPYSTNFHHLSTDSFKEITLGQVPLLINGVGVYFKQFFQEEGYFNRITSEHEFQELTESTKQSKAFRKGIYLTEVTKVDQEEKWHYHLLRCSSNLTGPTDNFRSTDKYIIHALNHSIQYIFEDEVKVNHILAQVYENSKIEGLQPKEKKAKIAAHSDKTKDMTPEGLIAFCTFYEPTNFKHLKPSETDPYDWCHKGTSGLTRLQFKLKPTVEDTNLVKEFTVTLYPNSVFIIPLSTNRLYTHAIKPSMLNIDRIPTRMGYVGRCSNTEAVFMNNQAYIKEGDELVKLQPMTEHSMKELRDSYYEENKYETHVKYGKVHFSMNAGDYLKPLY